MPVAPARPGPLSLQVTPRLLNCKNPACYVWPAANGCKAGDHFRVDQAAALEHFARFEPFAVHMPLWQSAANAINLTALLSVCLWLGLASRHALQNRRARRTLASALSDADRAA
jgi:hypothetical protein